jgi:hypothetical protein
VRQPVRAEILADEFDVVEVADVPHLHRLALRLLRRHDVAAVVARPDVVDIAAVRDRLTREKFRVLLVGDVP